MLRKWTILLLALLLTGSALAEVYEGTTGAMSTVTVTAEDAGTAQEVSVQSGDRVEAGDALLELRSERAFAAQDGTVSLLYAEEGEDVDGTVLELSPLEHYQVYCTVDSAYQSAESTLVHSGETVYIRCTSDGTHRAVGVITLVEGEEYRVLTLGGELYVGETVYLYRDEDFTSSQRVGIGTVVVSDTQAYEASGRLSRLNVAEGDTVERGQLLYEIGGGRVEAPVSGIVTAVDAHPGDSVEEGQAVASIVPDGQVCVEIQVPEAEAAGIQTGQTAELTLAGEDDEQAFSGTVESIAWVAEDGLYTVRILPEDGTLLPLGMSVTVRI